MKRKAFALIFCMLLIVALLTLGTASFSRSATDTLNAARYMKSTKAFWIAEAGINFGLVQLRSDFTTSDGTGVWAGSVGEGQYSIDLGAIESSKRTMTCHGYIPSISDRRIERIIEVEVSESIPSNFYDNAIYSAGDVDLNGDAYSIDGDVHYADEINNTDNINGTVTQDPSIDPLARFDFEQLRSIAQSQNNVYDANRLNNEILPSSFWYSDPTDPADPSTGTPNVVYIECDLALNGNVGTIGGFLVVVGDVLTNPGDTYDATINGNGQIDGLIYTLGEFSVNGGGNNLNVNGGVWAGEGATLNGNAYINYNQDYMVAVASLDIKPDAQIVTWKEIRNPYPLD